MRALQPILKQVINFPLNLSARQYFTEFNHSHPEIEFKKLFCCCSCRKLKNSDFYMSEKSSCESFLVNLEIQKQIVEEV